MKVVYMGEKNRRDGVGGEKMEQDELEEQIEEKRKKVKVGDNLKEK